MANARENKKQNYELLEDRKAGASDFLRKYKGVSIPELGTGIAYLEDKALILCRDPVARMFQLEQSKSKEKIIEAKTAGKKPKVE